MAPECLIETPVLRTLCSRATAVRLLPEQIDPSSCAFLGNFPQAFSHVGLISIAVNLIRLKKQRSEKEDSQLELRERAWEIVQPVSKQAQREAAAKYHTLAGTGLIRRRAGTSHGKACAAYQLLLR